MENQSCVFCAIVAKKIPATYIDENESVIVIRDISPKAPTHYLIIPKKHIQDLSTIAPEDAVYAQAIMMMANQLSKRLTGSKAFRLIINNGSDVGQSVFHLHSHFLSGKKMTDF
jgi:histidine triad (HIT) family protein